MKRLTIVGLAILLSLVLSLSSAVSTTSQAVYRRYPTYKAVDYSYTHWRQINRNTLPPACTYSIGERGVSVCLETDTPPDTSEFIEWTSWETWNNCYQYNQREACEELTN